MKTQWLRRVIQITVVLLLAAVPLVNFYGVKREQRDADAITQSPVLTAVDGVLGDLPRKQAVELSHAVKGSVWTADVLGFKVSDPLAAIESTTTSMTVCGPLWLSALVPVLLTVLLGRAFCGWVCPMNLVFEINDKLRGLLLRTGYNVRNIRFGRFTKYVVLGVGLAVAFAVGMPILSLLYPPAVLSREVYYRVYTGAFGSGLLLLAGICFIELILSRRWWCRYVCAGGAVYSALAYKSRLRIRRDDARCNQCGDCVPTCPYDLRPMTQDLGADCDQCGRCVRECDPGALAYTLRLLDP